MDTYFGTGLAQSPRTSPASGGDGGRDEHVDGHSAPQEPQAGSVEWAGGSSFAGAWQVRVSHVFALLSRGGALCTSYSSPHRSICKGFIFYSDSASSESQYTPTPLVFLAAELWGRSGF